MYSNSLFQAEPVALWNERQAREKQARSPKCEESGLVGVWQVMVSDIAADIVSGRTEPSELVDC